MTRKRQGARVGWRYLDRATETWKPLDSLNREPGVAFNYNAKSLLEQQVFLKRFSPDPNSIYIFTNHRNGRMELDLYNLKQGRIERRLFASEGYDLGGPNVPSARILYEKNGWEAIGLVSQARMPTVTWLDERFKNHQDRMDAFFPDCVNIPLDWSENGSVMIYHSFNEKSFGRIFVFRPEKNEIRQIYNRSPKLDNQVLGTMSFLSFKSRDGYSLHGYLTLPPGSEGRNLPLLVYPHGGPMVRDTWGFDPRVQYFATRGYAVMQVNYRGSSGYGIEHCRSGLEGELGGVIIDDIADGARFLISEGIADPDRIAIAGASFGGYCTYMSLIRYPELYQVGVAVAAISHWRNLLNTNQYYGNQYGFRFWKEIIRRSSDDDYAKKISPYFRANEFSRPVKIIHGKLDYTVPYGQATIMEKALKNAGKEVELVVFPYQGHSILSFSTYGMNQGIRYLEEIEVFLDKHLPPKRKVTDEDTVTLVPSSSPVAGSP